MSEAIQNTQTQAERMAAARAARAERADAAPEVAAPVAAAADPEVPPAPAGPSLLERAAANQEQARLAKIAALRAAKLSNADPVGEPEVKVRVLKRGGGKISMGEHISGLGDLTYDAGETPMLPKSLAQTLEDRGLVEID